MEPTLELFKMKIRKWKCESCPCRIYKTYRVYQLIKILASILPMVDTNLFYHALKHCIGGRVDFDWLLMLCTV